MLIIYRTNAGYEGDIVSLDTVTPAAALASYLTQQDAPALAALEVAEATLSAETLGALFASVGGYGAPGRFYVAEVAGVISLVDGGV